MALTTREMTQHEFGSIREEWNQLLAKSSCDNVFLTWEWIWSWWNEFSEGKELCIIEVRKNDRLIGIAPFYLERLFPLFKWRVLKICSSEDLHSDYLDIIASKGEEKTVSDAVFRYLINEKNRWIAGFIDNLLDNSNLAKFTNDYSAKSIAICRNASVCPYLKITSSYDEYLKKNFKRKKRYNLKRQIQRVLNEKKVSFIQVTSTEDLPGRIDKLFELHAKRFHKKRQKSTFDSVKIKKFLQKFSRLALEKGILDFYLLCDLNEPISAMYGLKYGNKHYYYQSGADTCWSKYSVGTVLLNLVIEKCFNDGLNEFDFLKGSENYKASWMSGQRAEQQIKIYRRCFMGYVLYATTIIKPVLKKGINFLHR